MEKRKESEKEEDLFLNKAKKNLKRRKKKKDYYTYAFYNISPLRESVFLFSMFALVCVN